MLTLLLSLAPLLATVPPRADVPLLEDHGHVFVSGTIASRSGHWIALDTGAARSVLDADVAAKLGVEASERGQTGGALGIVETGVALGVPVGFPGLALPPLDLDVVSLEPLSDHQGVPISLVLGHELFSRYVVELDYERGRMRLHDPATYRPAAGATSLPIDFVYNHPYVRATVVARGGARIDGRFVIDLGSSQSVILRPELVQKHKLIESTPTLKGSAGGIGGSFAVHTGRVKSLSVGPFTVPDPIAVMPLGGTVVDAEDAVGNLGAGFLRRFLVTFDYSRHRMLLTPNGRFGQSDEGDMSGLSLVAGGEGRRTVSVGRVREGGPGAEAGLREGDRIVTIDGKPLGAPALPRLRERFRQPKTYRLGVQRGEGRLKVVLRTRRQI